MTDAHDITSGDIPPPRHVAIIMDGNGRWAKRRGLPRVAGHRQGVEAVRRAVETAGTMGISYLTLFGFSSENWRRPQGEVRDLMGLLKRYLKSEIAELHGKNIRFRVIGERAHLDNDIRALLDDAERMTEGNTKLTLTLALSYGGRAEIADAARRIAQSAKLGLLQPEAVDESLLESYLWTVGIPDPDLLIRTSGEQRISNFLLWQCAYTEFFYTDIFWPDFDQAVFESAVDEFRRRDRRFGATASFA